MKKFVTIAMAVMVMFAAASQVQAAVALETSGEIRARLWMTDNYLQDKHEVEWWDQRLRLFGKWAVAENVTVQFRADILEGFWGENRQVPQYDATQDPTTGAIAVKQTLLGTAAKDPIAFDWVNLTFVWPNTPLTITVGRQDASWGPGFALKSDNVDRFKVVGKFGAVTALYAYTKNQELFAQHDTGSVDDSRSHALGAMTTLAGFNTGLIFSYTINEASAAVDITRLLVDAFLTGKAGPVDIKGEVAFVTGKNDNAATADVDYQGLGVYLGAFLPAGPVGLGLEAAYVSGDDPGTKDKNEGAFSEDYQGPFYSIILFNNLDVSGYAGESNLSGDTSLANAIAGKFSVSAKPLPALALNGAVVYATRDQVAAGKSKDMGVEIDLVGVYSITENVSWTIGAGYLVAGDYYGDVKDPWGAVSAFTVKF